MLATLRLTWRPGFARYNLPATCLTIPMTYMETKLYMLQPICYLSCDPYDLCGDKAFVVAGCIAGKISQGIRLDSFTYLDISKRKKYVTFFSHYQRKHVSNVHTLNLNIGILQMTGEVPDRSNEITLFGTALFWQKAIEFFAKFIIHFLTYRVEHLFNSEFYCLAKSN